MSLATYLAPAVHRRRRGIPSDRLGYPCWCLWWIGLRANTVSIVARYWGTAARSSWSRCCPDSATRLTQTYLSALDRFTDWHQNNLRVIWFCLSHLWSACRRTCAWWSPASGSSCCSNRLFRRCTLTYFPPPGRTDCSVGYCLISRTGRQIICAAYSWKSSCRTA